jgi:hypothetical protein
VAPSKVGEKSGIRQEMKARRVVRYHIEGPRDKVLEGDVTVETLVHGALPQNGGGGGRRGDRSLAIPIKSGGVVGRGAESPLANVEALRSHIVVKVGSDQFQLGVVDGTPRVIEGDEVGGNGGWEWNTPHDRDWVCRTDRP